VELGKNFNRPKGELTWIILISFYYNIVKLKIKITAKNNKKPAENESIAFFNLMT
jgi:hypothetical protein